ncbi:hypothetical protein AQJ43_24300 [Streptomyces avermitilis]|nr:hypothetical protein AQJ43_24300 [Streptomyces avermitilis]
MRPAAGQQHRQAHGHVRMPVTKADHAAAGTRREGPVGFFESRMAMSVPGVGAAISTQFWPASL